MTTGSMVFQQVVLLLDETHPARAGWRIARRFITDDASIRAVIVENHDLRRWRSLPLAGTDAPDAAPPGTGIPVPASDDRAGAGATRADAPVDALQNALTVIPCPANATWVGSRWQRDAPRGTVLYVNEPWESGSSVLAVVDGGDRSLRRRTLEISNWLARREQCLLRVAGVDATPPEGVPTSRYVHAAVDDPDQVLALCDRFDARVVVCPRDLYPDWRGPRARLMALLDSSLLLVA